LDVRLIATDLDGTLLDSGRRPHPLAVEALRRAHRAGLALCLASGRVSSAVRSFAGTLGLPCWIVACNGAHALAPDGRELCHASLQPRVREAVEEFAREMGCHLNLYSRDQVVCLVEGPLGDMYRARVRQVLVETPPTAASRRLSATKMMLVAEPERVPEFASRFAARFSPGEVAITVSEAEYLEFLPPGVDKSHGLAHVAAALGICRAEVAAIGDFHNDIEMIRWAGLGGAVANAEPEVRAVADVIVASNDEGGCAEFVDAILENLR
jgi:Cof subfamily protein (haloacid dehalogenase superfamily)